MNDKINDPKYGLWSRSSLIKMYPKEKDKINDLYLNNERLAESQANRKPKQYRLTKANFKNHIWQLDLLDISPYKDDNDGNEYLLIAIDVFSRFAYAVPLKNKSAKSVINGLKILFQQDKPSVISFDRGKEFDNETVNKFLHNQKVFFFFLNPPIKGAIVERFNRTLWSLINKYQTLNNTLSFVNVLQDLLYNYNHKVHRTIKKAPVDVDEYDQYHFSQMNEQKESKIKQVRKFKVDDYVKISKERNIFDKEIAGYYTYEIFKVSKVIDSKPITYKLVDLKDEPIEGIFYSSELKKVNMPDQYEVEKILDEKGTGRNKKYLIKWRGYSDKFNEWIPASQVKNISLGKDGVNYSTTSRIQRARQGKGIGDVINKAIDNLPFELHLPGHANSGPGTKVEERLKEADDFVNGRITKDQCKYGRCSLPLNKVDQLALQHDIVYHNHKDAETRRLADQELLNGCLEILKNKNNTFDVRTRIDASVVALIIKAKLGLS